LCTGTYLPVTGARLVVSCYLLLWFRAFRATICCGLCLPELGPGVVVARICRRVAMEGSAPPVGGLVSPVNETLPSEPGEPGTELSTLNTTPGNTTHGTSHHAGGASGSATSFSQAAFSQSGSLAGINSNPKAARSFGPAPNQPINTPTTLAISAYHEERARSVLANLAQSAFQAAHPRTTTFLDLSIVAIMLARTDRPPDCCVLYSSGSTLCAFHDGVTHSQPVHRRVVCATVPASPF
jgi:hypothetical protein